MCAGNVPAVRIPANYRQRAASVTKQTIAMPTEQFLIGRKRRHNTDHPAHRASGLSPPAMASLAPRASMGLIFTGQGAHKQRAVSEQARPAPTSAPPLALAPAPEASPTPLLGATPAQGPRLPRVSLLAASLLKLGAAWGAPVRQQQHPGMRRYQHAASTLAVQSADELEVRGGGQSLAQVRSSPYMDYMRPLGPADPRAADDLSPDTL